MTPKVSIIVPIYNAGKFLEKCLDTLVNQTLKDIEIILVLDCPTDGSDRIAREYAENARQRSLAADVLSCRPNTPDRRASKAGGAVLCLI